jgi:hypothetical protein
MRWDHSTRWRIARRPADAAPVRFQSVAASGQQRRSQNAQAGLAAAPAIDRQLSLIVVLVSSTGMSMPMSTGHMTLWFLPNMLFYERLRWTLRHRMFFIPKVMILKVMVLIAGSLPLQAAAPRR